MHFSKAAERAAWVEDLCGCALLVLDEPDKLKPSEGLVEIIYGILDERFANNELTILTTNAGGPELERRWGPEYGPYLVRRIREFCLAINFGS
jgi:DNA replication protein DnaC